MGDEPRRSAGQDTFSIFAVFDGHGPNGHEISHFVKDTRSPQAGERKKESRARAERESENAGRSIFPR